jgi:hypothetical protein
MMSHTKLPVDHVIVPSPRIPCTSTSHSDEGPRVCPFCPDVVVPSQTLKSILLSSQKENKKTYLKKKKCDRHCK